MIEFSDGSLGPNEWLKYQCGDGHSLTEIPDSSDLFTVTCVDGEHTMTHCKPVQCGNPHATKLAKLIMKGQGCLRQTSVAILNIDTDVTDGLKWRLCKAAQQSQIPLIFVCDDGVDNARDDLVQKCLCLEVQHELRNVEQALRRVMQLNGLNVPEACFSIAIACAHDVRQDISAAQTLGQRSSSSELPAVDLSASDASLHSGSVAERRH